MTIDDHEIFQRMADESLAGGISPERERSLREHLDTCASCSEYLNAGNRVVAGLRGFSFEVDRTLDAKILASLRRPAQPSRRRWVSISVAAAVLTIFGSFADLQFGNLIASVFGLQRAPVREDLLTLWIVPSLFIFLLFPLLPLLSKPPDAHRKERAL